MTWSAQHCSDSRYREGEERLEETVRQVRVLRRKVFCLAFTLLTFTWIYDLKVLVS